MLRNSENNSYAATSLNHKSGAEQQDQSDSCQHQAVKLHERQIQSASHYLRIVVLNPKPLCRGPSLCLNAIPAKAAGNSPPGVPVLMVSPSPNPPRPSTFAPIALPPTRRSASLTFPSTSRIVSSIHCRLLRCALRTAPICCKGSSSAFFTPAEDSDDVVCGEFGSVRALTDSIIWERDLESSLSWRLRFAASV